MKQKFSALAQVFCLPGDITDYEVISNGNINATYDVTMTVEGKERHFVFQKINIFVFKSPKRIMKNIEKITSHIAEKLEAKLVPEKGYDFYTIDVMGFSRKLSPKGIAANNIVAEN